MFRKGGEVGGGIMTGVQEKTIKWNTLQLKELQE